MPPGPMQIKGRVLNGSDHPKEPGPVTTPSVAPAPIAPAEVSHGALIRIAVPMTLGYLTTPLVGIVAMAAVGHLGDAGLIGGVALGSIVTDVVFSTCNFLRSGTTGLTAQAVGRGDGAAVRAVLLRALAVGLGLGALVIAALPLILWLAPLAMQPGEHSAPAMATFLAIRLFGAPLLFCNFALFGWLLGQGRSGLGLLLLTVLNGVTIVVALTLVAGLGLGVTGAALAPVAGDAVALILGLVIVRRSLARPVGRVERLLDPTALKAMFAVNRDIMIRSFVLLFAFAYFARAGAAQGDVVLAANAILEKFFLVGGYFLDGVAAAAETFVGQAVGARHRASFDRAVRLSWVWGGGLALLCSAALYGAGGGLIALMTSVVPVRETAAVYLAWAALTPLAGVAAFNLDGIYIGATWSRDMRNMMVLSLVLFLAAEAVLMPLLGNHGLWLAFLVFLGARGLSLGALLPSRAARTFA